MLPGNVSRSSLQNVAFYLCAIYWNLDDWKSQGVEYVHVTKLKDAFSVFGKCRHNGSVGGEGNLFDDNKNNL